ncbi:GspH/FimT family pseudopilin [Psychrobacter immobilis]|uniref:GspH/FimT family pseudopilin n=1 Tax=Psychrobacter immobilis TaxID=498 RepID=UPI001D0F4E19|nr:GspH/FimT family pseudopilin [Psychrobacter immobilis]
MNASAKNVPYQLRMNSSGFTLIELMVTIAVLAIIVGIAAPSMSTQLANQRVKSTAATLANALKEAKAESIIRRQNITVVYSSTNPKTITLQDVNNNDISTYNIHDQSDVTETIAPSTVTDVTFQPNKVVADGAAVTYTICDSGSSSETPRQVRISRVTNISTVNAGDC